MRPFLNLIINTIPTQDPAIRHVIQSARRISDTSVDGMLGHVVSIGWSVDRKNSDRILKIGMPEFAGFCSRDLAHFFDHEAGTGDDEFLSLSAVIEAERDWLNTAFRLIELDVADVRNPDPIIVGHHVAGFAVPFLTKRAAVLGVTLPKWWPMRRAAGPGDMMISSSAERDGWISFDALCQAFGMLGKFPIAGVTYDMWKEGRQEAIWRYSSNNVFKVSQIHRQIRLAFWDIAGIDESRTFDARIAAIEVGEAAS